MQKAENDKKKKQSPLEGKLKVESVSTGTSQKRKKNNTVITPMS